MLGEVDGATVASNVFRGPPDTTAAAIVVEDSNNIVVEENALVGGWRSAESAIQVKNSAKAVSVS